VVSGTKLKSVLRESHPRAVGGLFKPSLQREPPAPFVFVVSLSPYLAPRGERRREKTGIPGASLCRLGLNNPPTSVGGIPGVHSAEGGHQSERNAACALWRLLPTTTKITNPRMFVITISPPIFTANIKRLST
jgi:hypothetical protein